MRNVADKICKEDQNAYFVFNYFFFPGSSAIYEMMWKNWYSQTGHGWQYDTVYALCVLEN